MPPVRIRIYGLFPMTRRTYLRIQLIGLGVVSAMAAACASLLAITGRWLPRLYPPDLQSLVAIGFWACVAVVVYDAIETPLMLRKFDRAEAKQQQLAAPSAGAGS